MEFNTEEATRQNPLATASTLVTFWTVCHNCSGQFEYLRKYCNKTLLCRRCGVRFKAVEIPGPLLNINQSATSLHQGVNLQGPVKETVSPNEGPAHVVQPLEKRLKRGFEEAGSLQHNLQPTKTKTLWTLCSCCKIQLVEYERSSGDADETLVCHKCRVVRSSDWSTRRSEEDTLASHLMQETFNVSRKTGTGLATGSSTALGYPEEGKVEDHRIAEAEETVENGKAI